MPRGNARQKRNAKIAREQHGIHRINGDLYEARERIAELETLLLTGLALYGGEAHTDSEREWRAAARKALNLARS